MSDIKVQLKTDGLKLTLKREPGKITSLMDLPNWRLEFWNDKKQEKEFLYAHIFQWREPDEELYPVFKKFLHANLGTFGLELLLGDNQHVPGISPMRSVYDEFLAYWVRRGKNFETKLMSAWRKTPARLQLRLPGDAHLRTYTSELGYPMVRKNSVIGKVHYADHISMDLDVSFELYHPFLDLRHRISQEDLAICLDTHVKSCYPFMPNIFTNWQATNLVTEPSQK